jgi:hypothetical protein
MDVLVIPQNTLMVDGILYKRIQTVNGRYSTEQRRLYMQEYRRKIRATVNKQM